MKSCFAVAIAIGVGSCSLAAGEQYAQIGSLSRDSIVRMEQTQPYAVFRGASPTCDLNLYKLHYRSTDFSGGTTVLSGLLVVPGGGAPKGLVVYFHGTAFNREGSPSCFSDWDRNEEAALVSVAFAADGYAVAMPDYLGLGDNLGVHPYPLGDINSRSGIDMIGPAEEIVNKAGVSLGPGLYITGYSEGGAVAMWALRHLEEKGFHITKAAPMSGPYDLSGVTARSFIRGRQSFSNLAIKLYLIGYAAFSALANQPGIKLSDYFAPSFASYVPFVFGQRLADAAIAKKLLFKGFQMGAFDSLNRVLTRSFRSALSTGDLGNPMVAELHANDCFDWRPTTPMLLPYLTTDSIVPPENTLETIEAMRKNGVPADLVKPYPITEPGLNHISAIVPALAAARDYFDSN